MIAIKILIIIFSIYLCYLAISRFNQHCFDKFGYVFFSTNSFYMITAIILSFHYGLRLSKSLNQDTALNGLVLLAFGAVVLAYLYFRNLKQSNFIYGVLGSTLQLGLFGFIAYQSIPFMFLFLICFLVSGIPQSKSVNVYRYW